MAPSTIVFPKQGFVQYNLVKATSSRGPRERLVQAKKQSRKRPQTPPPPAESISSPVKRSRKRKRLDATADEPYGGPSSRIQDQPSLGYDGFPALEDDGPSIINLDAFRGSTGTTTAGKVRCELCADLGGSH
jgi:hypothetical protein